MGDLIKSVGDAVAVPEEPSDRLIWLAIQHGADVEKLEKLIALKNAEEARMAKRLYDEHFAEMQAEFEPITKDVMARDDNKDKDLYLYATLGCLQRYANPIISKHGFSYRWREESIEKGKRCILRISGWGHSEENSFDIPQLQGTQIMNAVQVAGSMSTYGQRYTFRAGFGLIVEDGEDDDAISIPADDAMTYFEEVKLIRESKTLAELKANFKLVWAKLAQGDTAGRAILTKEKDAAKELLSGTKNA